MHINESTKCAPTDNIYTYVFTKLDYDTDHIF